MFNDYLVLDFETTIANAYERCPNPFFQKILMIGIIGPWPYFTNNPHNLTHFGGTSTSSNYLKHFLELDISWPYSTKLIIGHNIKFDLLHIWENDWFQNWLQQGGQIWDTQLAEYILTGQQAKYSALRDIAVKKYNCKPRCKYLEWFLEMGYKMEEIPNQFLALDVESDVKDTEQIYLQQYKIAEKNNQLKLIELHMQGLLATTEAEYNGFKVGVQILQANKEKLQSLLGQVKQDLEQQVEKYWK